MRRLEFVPILIDTYMADLFIVLLSEVALPHFSNSGTDGTAGVRPFQLVSPDSGNLSQSGLKMTTVNVPVPVASML